MGDVVSSHLDEAKRGIIAGEGLCGLCGFRHVRFHAALRERLYTVRGEEWSALTQSGSVFPRFHGFLQTQGVFLSGSRYLCVGSEAVEPTLAPIRTPEPLSPWIELNKTIGTLV